VLCIEICPFKLADTVTFLQVFQSSMRCRPCPGQIPSNARGAVLAQLV